MAAKAKESADKAVAEREAKVEEKLPSDEKPVEKKDEKKEPADESVKAEAEEIQDGVLARYGPRGKVLVGLTRSHCQRNSVEN